METKTLTLSEFLLARIAEDEYAARAFVNELGEAKRWRADDVGGKVRQVQAPVFGLSDVVAESDTHLTAAHIARHDPARVLAECEAKRRIVGSPAFRDSDPDYELTIVGERIVGALALPYADHPDYDEAWRP